MTKTEAHSYAAQMDAKDTLGVFRNRFHIPLHHSEPVAYFCGNSLGLVPRATADAVQDELEDWKNLGVEGHFHARKPWFSYHRLLTDSLARLTGAKPHEVVAMNSLTANLHLLMTSLYRPTADRYRIVIAGNEFPSDRYAVESQVRLHGHDPEQAMIEVAPDPGTYEISTQRLEEAIAQHGESVALVLISGVHFFTGQFFDIPAVVRAAKSVGAVIGVDLAHAIGNVELHLHDWDVDFAVWCSYKYLNSGPGGVGGAFVHERYAARPDLPRLAGWWGNEESTRFMLQHGFEPTYGADGWQLSNAPVLSMAAHRAALDIFDEAGMAAISVKRTALTGFLETLVNAVFAQYPIGACITPRDPAQRGAQLSLRFEHHGREVYEKLLQHGVIVDWRTPNVIRVAPAPLYVSFADVARFYDVFLTILSELP